MADKAKLNAEGILSLESAFVKVPFEQLKKSNRRAQKHTEKELGNLATGVSDLAKGKGSGAKDPVKALDAMIERMGKLRRKLRELKNEELNYCEKTSLRLGHLRQLSHIKTLDAPEYFEWSQIRLQRALLDYLMRNGYMASAKLLAASGSLTSANKSKSNPSLTNASYSNPVSASGDGLGSSDSISTRSGIGGLVRTEPEQDPSNHHSTLSAGHVDLSKFADIEFFTQSRKIEVSLDRRSCTEALAWCSDNKTALKKIKSTLEFNLRLQEFIELARARKLAECIDYAKQHLSGFPEHFRPLQQVMGLLAFPPDTLCEPYRTFYDSEARWKGLQAQFRADNYALHSLSPVSALNSTLQAGLAALKTSKCNHDGERNINCPVCIASTYAILAEKLPLGHHVNSCYVCRITGEIMNEDNPPMVTPEGYVYSFKAVHEMASKNNGQFRCPRTHTVFPIEKLKKMFLT